MPSILDKDPDAPVQLNTGSILDTDPNTPPAPVQIAPKAIHGGPEDKRPLSEKITDPEIYKKIAFGDPSQEIVQGLPPMMIPAGKAVQAVGKMAQGLGQAGNIDQVSFRAPEALERLGNLINKNWLTRSLGGAAQAGGTQAVTNMGEGKSPLEGVPGAMAMGAGLNMAGEAVSAGPRAVRAVGEKFSRFTSPQAEAYVKNPKSVSQMAEQLSDPLQLPALENAAKGAFDTSRAALKGKGLGEAKSLSDLLNGKNVNVNASDLYGISPEIDSLLATRAPGANEYTRPKNIDLDANVANDIKRKLQKMSEYKPGTILEPTQAAKNADLASKASTVRKSIEGVGGDDVKALNKSMQDSMMLQEALRKAGKSNPLAFISSEAPGRMATLARAENMGAGGLLDFGNKLGAAKEIIAPDVGSAGSLLGIPAWAVKMGGRGLLRTGAASQPAFDVMASPGKNPIMRQLLLNQTLGEDAK